jgi:pimeloyl-ACP methyl ester carboxylesterase
MAPDRLTGPTNAQRQRAREYREHRIPRGTAHLYAREYRGQGPVVLLMHGFPDDLHLYDRLVPELAGRFGAADPYLNRQVRGGSTSCCRPRSCSCWKGPATTCNSTNHSRSPG